MLYADSTNDFRMAPLIDKYLSIDALLGICHLKCINLAEERRPREEERRISEIKLAEERRLREEERRLREESEKIIAEYRRRLGEN